jgi:hypothetical protein
MRSKVVKAAKVVAVAVVLGAVDLADPVAVGSSACFAAMKSRKN